MKQLINSKRIIFFSYTTAQVLIFSVWLYYFNIMANIPDHVLVSIGLTILALIIYYLSYKWVGSIVEMKTRFILETMPGKQMAIDADLNNGKISTKEAEAHRTIIDKDKNEVSLGERVYKYMVILSKVHILIVLLITLAVLSIQILNNNIDTSLLDFINFALIELNISALILLIACIFLVKNIKNPVRKPGGL